MPRPRSTLVSLDATPYYHCTTRCVRRALLCGEDRHSGRSFEHRRQWIEDRLLILAGIYAIDIAVYAVMSNHYHVVLHIDREQSLGWSDIEVIERWHRRFKGSLLSQRFKRGEPLFYKVSLAKRMIILPEPHTVPGFPQLPPSSVPLSTGFLR